MNVNVNSIMTHSEWMGNSAHNVANVNNEDFDAQRTIVTQDEEGSISQSTDSTESRTDLAREFTEQISIENGLEANVLAAKAQDDMLGSILNILA